jgi:hypothetical protein
MARFFNRLGLIYKSMKRLSIVLFTLLFTLLMVSVGNLWAQQPNDTVLHRTVIAGKQYEANAWKKFLWGTDYREEWATPIQVPVLNLDTIFGGLTPIELGGGRQTKSLHMKDAAGRRYVLRTVAKTYTGALPEIARGTIAETIANDQIATNHPYAALTVPPLASASGVYHTNPHLYFVPYTPGLDSFNKVFANTLCLLEERPDQT